MNIAVIGAGYVGLSLAVLLSKHHTVVACDIDAERVNCINQRISPIRDAEIEAAFNSGELKLTATVDIDSTICKSDYIIIATPTNYDDEENFFDTSSVEQVLAAVNQYQPSAFVVIKSTVPIGFTERMQKAYPDMNLVFSPEFLREGRALYDNLYPSRIIVGYAGDGNSAKNAARQFAAVLKNEVECDETPVLVMTATEAEAVKLFANTYLALRVSFFNELDTYAAVKNLNSAAIIEGVSLDSRIGNYYNNPSFGYGGYCLPKDTKQLLANYQDVPQHLISATVAANETRIRFIADQIKSKGFRTIGVYRLTMKTHSDNFRESSVIRVMNEFLAADMEVVVYEPLLKSKTFMGCCVESSLEAFKNKCEIILANRYSVELNDIKDHVYTRDIFYRD